MTDPGIWRKLPSLEGCDVFGKKVLIRLDLNAPLRGGKILNDARLRACLPTVKRIAQAGGRVMLLSHLGRPEPSGEFQPEYSLAPIAGWLQGQLGYPVPLSVGWLDNPPDVSPGQIVMLENVRFYPGEAENDPELGRRMAGLCDLVVMEAFAVSHRANASTETLLREAPQSCAGPQLLQELQAMELLSGEKAQRPMVTVTGGAKVSDKLALLQRLTEVSDRVVVGGAMANTFLAALGHDIGESLYEPAMLQEAHRIHAGGKVLLPQWVVVGTSPEDEGQAQVRHIEQVQPGERIFDLAPRSFDAWTDEFRAAKTLLWNGPMGVFERPAWAGGTRRLAKLIADSDAYTVAGGGDTLSAVEMCQVQERLSFLSTGGGAFLTALEGSGLPALEALLRNGGG